MQTPITETLADVIKQIFEHKRNTKARNLFVEATKNLKPASCKVKVGWRSGESIGFVCIFEKNGDSEIFTEIEKGIENKNEIKHFIYGLNPKIFHFNPIMSVDEFKPNQHFIEFKLIRNETRQRKS